MPITVFAAPVHTEVFESAEQMCNYIEDYSNAYPDVDYAQIVIPSKGYELKQKDFLVVSIDNDDYTLTNLSCSETGYHHGIDYTFSSYNKNKYANVRILTYYQMSRESVTNSLDKLEENLQHGALYTGEVLGYRYAVCDVGYDDGSTMCTYEIAVDDVLIVIYSNRAFDKAVLDSLVIKNSGIKLPVLEALPEVSVSVSDELLEAVKAEYNNKKLTKEDIHISDLEIVDETKQLVRFTVSNYFYTCDVVEQTIGDYLLYVPQRPLPQILFDGVLYSIDKAYDSGILTDDDLETISTFESGSYKLTKIDELYGDVDGDKQITVLDATAIQRHLAQLDVLRSGLKCADVDRDGEVTILDATAIQIDLAKLD